MRFYRYMSVTLVKLSLTAALILAFIAEILDLVDNASDVLDRGQGMFGILRYVVFKMPTLVSHILPLGALIGALLTLLLLARNSEIVAMRAAGRSTWNMFIAMLPGALFLVVLHSTLIDVITPRTESRLAMWLTQDVETDNSDKVDTKPTWARVGDDIVSFGRVSDRGRKLKQLRVYQRDAGKLATGRLIAGEARYDKRKWILKDAERVSWAKETFNQHTPADGPWETSMTPNDVLASLTPENRISLTAARAVLAGQMTPNAPLPFYQTLVERVYAGPLGVLVMVLLAMPASLTNWRDVRSTRHGVAALVAGLFFLLSDGMLATLALTGVVSPVVGAWSALVLFGTYGVWRILKIDGGWRSDDRKRSTPPGRRLAEATS